MRAKKLIALSLFADITEIKAALVRVAVRSMMKKHATAGREIHGAD